MRTLTRQELYDLVWSRPLISVARELGLSDVGLAKRCRRESVPIPYRGYWARVTAGQTPTQTRLPNPNFNPPLAFLSPPKPMPPLDADGRPLPREPHRLLPSEFALRATIDTLANDTALPRPQRAARADRLPRIDTKSRAATQRAKLLATHLLALAKHLGWPFVPAKPERDRTKSAHLLVEGEPFTLRVRELQRKILRPLTPEALQRKQRGERVWQMSDWQPTGSLCLDIATPEYRSTDASIRETPKSPLEQRLALALHRLLDAAIRAKELRETQERWRREQQERAEREALRQQRAEHEQALVAELERQCGAWLRTKMLRRYLRELRRRVADSETLTLSIRETPVDFLAWADRYIDQLDPFSETPHHPDLAPREMFEWRNDRERLDRESFARCLGLRAQTAVKFCAGTDPSDRDCADDDDD